MRARLTGLGSTVTMEQILEFTANHLFLFSLLLAILMLLMWNLFGDILIGVKLVEPNELTRLINQEDARVVDLRTGAEFEKGHILDSLHIPLEELGNQLEKVNKFKDQGVILICTSGSVSPKEARKLMNEGYPKVYALKGGILTWQNANLPLTRGKS